MHHPKTKVDLNTWNLASRLDSRTETLIGNILLSLSATWNIFLVTEESFSQIIEVRRYLEAQGAESDVLTIRSYDVFRMDSSARALCSIFRYYDDRSKDILPNRRVDAAMHWPHAPSGPGTHSSAAQ